MPLSIRVIGLGLFGIVAGLVSFMMMDTSAIFFSRQKTIQPGTGIAISVSQQKTVQPETGVRITPAPHGANPIHVYGSPITNARSLLQSCCSKEFNKVKNNNLIQSSFEDINKSLFLPASNGFIDTAIRAYNQHHHLIIRPEDVWFSILVQINAYINAHAEEMRSMFVAHEGQKQLELHVEDKNIDITGKAYMGVDYAKFAFQIGKKIEENIIDPSLRTWFMPTFTTTKKSDQATASIIMMSAMQKYFTYTVSLTCGLPSVTLLGEKSDWEDMMGRLERLKTFGEEPTLWYGLLKPVLRRFVQSFDDPDGEDIRAFWQKIAHYDDGGSGPIYLSGWITAFSFWDEKGKCFHQPGRNPPTESFKNWRETKVLVLDDARYHQINSDDLPPGYASVPVTMNNNGFISKAEMVAGSVGMQISSSSPDINGTLDTVQPGSGWWMYEVKSDEERLEEARKKYEEEAKRYPMLQAPEFKGIESLAYFGIEL